jgi:hypothetical protein
MLHKVCGLRGCRAFRRLELARQVPTGNGGLRPPFLRLTSRYLTLLCLPGIDHSIQSSNLVLDTHFHSS